MLAEAYPDLKADQASRDLSEELTSTENKVGFSRQAYNNAVLDCNNAQGQFQTLPALARWLGYPARVARP